MQCCVAKTGFQMFDMLHAYGLAMLLTSASGLPVVVRDASLVYSVSCPTQTTPSSGVEILDQVLALPEVHGFQTDQQEYLLPSIQVEVLDGVLEAPFTRGERLLSLSDLFSKQRLTQSADHFGLASSAAAVTNCDD